MFKEKLIEALERKGVECEFNFDLEIKLVIDGQGFVIRDGLEVGLQTTCPNCGATLVVEPYVEEILCLSCFDSFNNPFVKE